MDDPLHLVGIVLGVFRIVIANFYREGSAAHLNNRRIIEIARKTLRVDSCRGDDNFQFRAFGQQLFKITNQKIDIQAALVGLIDNDGIVLIQKTVLLHFCQQHTVGHQFYQTVVADLIRKANFKTDQITNSGIEFIGNAVGHAAGGQSPRLGVGNGAGHAAAKFQADFRDLGGFTGTGLTSDDDYLIVGNGLFDVILSVTDRQWRIIDIRNRQLARRAPFHRRINTFDDLCQLLLIALVG